MKKKVKAPAGHHWMKSGSSYKLMKHSGKFVPHKGASLTAEFEVQTKHKNGSKKSNTKKKSTVNKAGNYTKPTMRKRLFEKIKAGSKGGRAGQWSARKAQMLAREYKKAGGGYK